MCPVLTLTDDRGISIYAHGEPFDDANLHKRMLTYNYAKSIDF